MFNYYVMEVEYYKIYIVKYVPKLYIFINYQVWHFKLGTTNRKERPDYETHTLIESIL